MALAGVLEIQLVAGIARLQADMDRATRTVGNATNQISRAADAAKAALAGIGAGIGLAQIIQMTDAYAKFTAQLRLASTSAREYAASYADVKRISTAAQQDLQATGMLYARIANGTRELGTSQKQVAAITETVNMALKVSGATAQESASAQLQLSQAFASGTLRGEEFNAVNEAAPRLMLALADGIGVPVGALKKMAEAGEITSKMMADVLPHSLEKLRDEAKEVQTIAGAFTVLKNNMMEFVGVQANASGGVAVLTGAIGLLADNLGLLAGTMLTIGATKLGTWLSSVATQAVANVAANRALVTSNLATAQSQVTAAAAASALAAARVTELRAAVLASEGQVALAITTNGLIPAQARAAAAAATHTAALAAQATALRAASVAGGVMRGALAFLGGPIGAIITALGLGATAWMLWGNKAKEGNDLAKESALEASVPVLAALDKQIARHEAIIRLRNQGLTLDQANKVNQKPLDALGALSSDLSALNNGSGQFAKMGADAVIIERGRILKAILELTTKINEEEKKGAAAAALTQGEARIKIMAEYATKQEQMNAKLAEARKLLGASFTADDEARIRKHFAAKDAGAKQEATAYQSLITSIGEKIAANKLEMSGYDKLSDAQKMTIKLDEAIASGKNKLTPKHIEATRALIATVAAQDQAIERTNSMAKIQAEYAADIGKSVEAANKEVVAQEELVSTFGMAKSAIQALEVARMEERLERLRGIDMADDEVAALELVIAAKKRSVTALASVETMEANKKAFDKMTEDGKRMAESIENSLTDALMRGFESGKSFGRNLMDTLKNMFKTLVLRPTIQAILAPVSGSIASMMPGSAQAATSGSDVMSIAQSAQAAYKAISMGFDGIATTVADTVQGIMYQSGMTTQIAGNGAFASGAGAAAGYTVGAAVGVYGGRAISNGYAVGGGSGNAAVNIGTIAGAILGGPIGAAIGGLIGGAVNRLFGMREKEITSTTLAGSFGSNGFSGSTNSAWMQKGGVFRSDKSGVDSTAIDAATAKQFTAGYDALKAASVDFATVLGVNADSIAARSQSMSIAITKDAAANEKAIADFFVGVGDALARELVPSLADFAKEGEGASATLQRIAGNYAFIDAAFDAIGKTFGAVGLDSVAARERLIELSGGVELLGKGSAFFAQNFLSEAERMAPVQAQVTAEMARLGLAGVTTRDQFKQTVLGLDLTTESGATTFAGLMKVQEAFALVTPAAETAGAAVRSLADILGEAASLQDQLDSLTMSPTALAAKARGKIDPSNLKLYDDVQIAQGVKDLAATNKTYLDQLHEMARATMTSAQLRADDIIGMDESTIKLYDLVAARKKDQAAADTLASTNQGYQQQIDALVKAGLPLAEQRALEVAGMDASTLALYERLEALKGDAAASAANAALMESNQARADAAYAKSVSERQAAESAAAAQAQALLNQRVGMETTLYNLTHTASEQLARSRGLELASMDATLRPLQSQIFAMQDQASAAAQAATALENAAAAARAIASERGGLQREMFQMQGDTAALRKLELEALDPSNRALKESIFALQDKMAADQAAAQAAAAAAAMAQQIAQAQAQAQAQAAEEQRRAVEEQVRAAEQLKNAWQGITTSIFDEVARIRGLMSGSDTSLSSAQTKFAIATAQARSGDQEAARLLPQLSQAMLQIADATAITALDLRRIQAQTAASLSQTGMGLTSQYGPSVPSYDVGTDYVPRTGMALIHEGERITPAAYNRPYTRDQSLDTSKLEAAVERLTATVERQSAELAEIKRSTRRSADTLDVVTEGGSAMRTTV